MNKNKKYSNLMTKLNKATNYEYYYEAIFIEYAIIEDRTESLLRHANVDYKNSKGFNYKLAEKIGKIKSRKEFQDKYIKKHIPDELLNQIMEWKRNRDRLMHNIINIEYDNREIKDIALEGECLVKRLNNKSSLVNGYLDKIDNCKIKYKEDRS